MRPGRGYALALVMTAAATASCNFILGVGYDWEGHGGAASASSATGTSTSSGQMGGTGGTGGAMLMPGDAVWATKLGTSNDDTVNAVAVIAADHHVYLTGKTGSSGDFGCMAVVDAGSQSGGYLVELDEKGKCVWGMFFGAAAEGTGIAVDSGQNLVLTGTFTGDINVLGYVDTRSATSSFAAQIKHAGKTLVWGNSFYGDSSHSVIATSVVTDLSNAYIGLYADGPLSSNGTTIDSSVAEEDGFIIKCPNTSPSVCTKFIGISGAMKQELRGLAMSPDGSEVSLAGTSEGATGFNAAPVDPPISTDVSTNAIMASFQLSGSTNMRYGIYGDDQPQSGLRVAYGGTTQNPLFLAGKFAGMFNPGAGELVNTAGQDIFLARFDVEGTPGIAGAMKQIQIGGDTTDSNDIGGLVANAAGDVFLVGTLRSSATAGTTLMAKSNGGDDAFVLRLDQDFNPKWFRPYGDSSNQGADAIAFDTDGDIIVAGHFQGMIDLGGGHTLQATGGSDVFVAKLKP